MKKNQGLCLILAVVLAVSLIPLCAVAESPSFVKMSANVSLRSGPGTNYYAYTELKTGVTTLWLDNAWSSSGALWYKVKQGGTIGYVSASYTKLISNAGTARATSEVALRTGAGTGYTKLLDIPSGKTARLYGCAWDSSGTIWYEVSYNGKTGYICGKYALPEESAYYSDEPYYSGYGSQTARLTESRLASRSGPSTRYSEPGAFLSRGARVTLLSRAYDSMNEIWWVQAEFTENGVTRRVYTGSWRFDAYSFDLYSLPEEYLITSTSVSTARTLRYGPGDRYASMNKTPSRGQQVKVYAYENGWAQIELTVGGTLMRGWIPEGCLR